MARIEVYQPIGKDKTPEGPHTHLLPDLLKTARTHSANIAVPDDHWPCLNLYPANPFFDGQGGAKPFDAAHHAAFQELMQAWAAPEYQTMKDAVCRAVEAGISPQRSVTPSSRLERLAARVAIRQLIALKDGDPTVAAWHALLEPGHARPAEDETEEHACE